LTIYKKLKLCDAFWFQEGPGVRNTQFRDEGIKLLNVANITKSGLDLEKTSRHLDVAEVEGKYAHFLTDVGDLVIASSGITVDTDGMLRTRGAFVLPSHLPLCMNTSTIRFKSKEGVSDLRYLKYWLQSFDFRSQISRLVTGSAQKNFGPSHLNEIEINLPDLVEQKRLADILDNADKLGEKRKRSLPLLGSLRKSVFVEMFGDPADNIKNFEQIRLKDLTSIGTGTTPSRTIDANFDGDINWLKTGDIKGRIFGTEEKISEQAKIKHRCRIYPVNSIVIAMYGQGKTLGRAGLLGIESTTNQACAVLQPNERYAPEYMLALLGLSYERLRLLGRGGNQPNLNKDIVGEFLVSVPPLELQRDFSRFYQKSEILENRYKESIERFEVFSNRLNYRAFSGQLTCSALAVR
jgi:type I restriction enzyme S subunit